jgi:virginiamycin B lyase
VRFLLLSCGLAAASNALAVRITETPIPTAASQPVSILAGPDGRMYFTESAANKLGVYQSGFGIFEVPMPDGSATGPKGLTLASGVLFSPLGRIVVAGYGNGHLAAWDPVFQTPMTDVGSGLNGPEQLVRGPDGRLWATEGSSSSLYALHWDGLSPASARYALPTAASHPEGIAVSADGARIWFTEHATGKVGYCLPDGTGCKDAIVTNATSYPYRIVAGRNGMYFTEFGANKVGRATVDIFSGNVVTTEKTCPTASAHPFGIAIGPDGNVWFVEQGVDKIGKWDLTADTITEYPIPTAASVPTDIALGPDGSLYFLEYAANKLGRVEVFVPGDVNGDAAIDVADVFYLINYLFAGGPAPK